MKILKNVMKAVMKVNTIVGNNNSDEGQHSLFWKHTCNSIYHNYPNNSDFISCDEAESVQWFPALSLYKYDDIQNNSWLTHIVMKWS